MKQGEFKFNTVVTAMVIIHHYSSHVVEGWCYWPCLGLFAYLFPLCFFWWIIYRQRKWQRRSLMATVSETAALPLHGDLNFFIYLIYVQSRFLHMFCRGFVVPPSAGPFHWAEETVPLCCCNDYRVETSKERENGTEGRVEIKWKNTVSKNMLPHHTDPICTDEWEHTSPDQSRGRKHF